MIVSERFKTVLQLTCDQVALSELVIIVGSLGISFLVNLLQSGILYSELADLENCGLVPSGFKLLNCRSF